MTQKLSSDPVHRLPADLKASIAQDPRAQVAWENITPLARNEWICWTVSVKKQETRNKHVVRAREDLIAGKRRPCCWAGCPHRSKLGA